MKLSSINNTSLWQRVLCFPLVQLALGWLAIVYLPASFQWGWDIWVNLSDNRIYTLAYLTLGLVAVHLFMHKLSRYPGTFASIAILPILLIVSAIGAIGILVFRLPYSNGVLLPSFFLALVWFFALYHLLLRSRYLTFGIIPFGEAACIQEPIEGVKLVELNSPACADGSKLDALIVDFGTAELTGEWEAFLAQCALDNVPVYSARQISESLTGKVRLDHLSSNQMGQLAPSFIYSGIKRFVDIFLVLLTSPLWVPVVLVTAILIRRETPGPAFFIQERMGYRGKTFKAYKLRSMRTDLEGSSFTQDDDPRITKIGKFIRKTRIDELPQFLNVLKGEMSLIGPRPESLKLAEWYQKEIPFFNYRHIVRPGITGWAQVTQGYAAEIDGMTEKLEYDFFYIKRFSIWLDFLITLKTIKTMLTGFGSR